jgi:hypothetical protein
LATFLQWSNIVVFNIWSLYGYNVMVCDAVSRFWIRCCTRNWQRRAHYYDQMSDQIHKVLNIPPKSRIWGFEMISGVTNVKLWNFMMDELESYTCSWKYPRIITILKQRE